MENLDFIEDISLQKTIRDSIEYVYILFNESQKEGVSELYEKETYRVIILYIVSIIEALLLYLYKQSGKNITYLDYGFVCQLPENYHHVGSKENRVVIAVQRNLNKIERQIVLSELIGFLKDNKILKKETAEELLKMNSIRNTVHLSKPRDQVVCGIVDVESAFDLLLRVIKGVRNSVFK